MLCLTAMHNAQASFKGDDQLPILDTGGHCVTSLTRASPPLVLQNQIQRRLPSYFGPSALQEAWHARDRAVSRAARTAQTVQDVARRMYETQLGR